MFLLQVSSIRPVHSTGGSASKHTDLQNDTNLNSKRSLEVQITNMRNTVDTVGLSGAACGSSYSFGWHSTNSHSFLPYGGEGVKAPLCVDSSVMHKYISV